MVASKQMEWHFPAIQISAHYRVNLWQCLQPWHNSGQMPKEWVVTNLNLGRIKSTESKSSLYLSPLTKERNLATSYSELAIVNPDALYDRAGMQIIEIPARTISSPALATTT